MDHENLRRGAQVGTAGWLAEQHSQSDPQTGE
jgi:hypothetical protein